MRCKIHIIALIPRTFGSNVAKQTKFGPNTDHIWPAKARIWREILFVALIEMCPLDPVEEKTSGPSMAQTCG